MAARRSKGYSAHQSRRMSRRMEDSMVGSHVRRTTPSRSTRRTGAESMSFSSSRASHRATKGEVPGLLPNSTTREAAGAYHARIQQRRYIEEVQHRAKRRRILIFLAIFAVIIAAAFGVGCAVYMGTVGSEMALRDSDAAEALSAPVEKEPYYVLVSAELGAAATPLDNGGPDVLMLGCVDDMRHAISLVCIPGNTRVTMTDNESHPISDSASNGDAALISEVEKLTDIEISHFVKIDEKGLSRMVDELGGITVEVASDIDDPHAGSAYIQKGTQTLSGDQALVFLRATNLRFGEQDRMRNQLEFAAQLLSTLFSSSGTIDFAGKLDAIGPCFQTDYSSGDLISLASAYADLAAADVACIPAPGYMDADLGVESTGETAWVIPPGDIKETMREVSEGKAARAQELEVDTTGIDPSDFTIEVQNGTEMVGAAAGTADLLTSAGFRVVEVGNADDFVYKETLLVYHGDNGRAYAQMVIDELGLGRIVESSEYYDFDTDVLLILGADYKPMK